MGHMKQPLVEYSSKTLSILALRLPIQTAYECVWHFVLAQAACYKDAELLSDWLLDNKAEAMVPKGKSSKPMLTVKL